MDLGVKAARQAAAAGGVTPLHVDPFLCEISSHVAPLDT